MILHGRRPTREVKHVREGVQHSEAALVGLPKHVPDDALRQPRAGPQEAGHRHIVGVLVLRHGVQDIPIALCRAHTSHQWGWTDGVKGLSSRAASNESLLTCRTAAL